MKKTSIRLLMGATALCGWIVCMPATAGHETCSAQVCSASLGGEHPAGRDNDGDAIPDSEDWCSDSAQGDRVGYDGCAVGEIAVGCGKAMPVAAPARVAPRVPGPVVAMLDTDSDDDGVENDDDDCPGTPRAAAVNKHGCVEIEKVVLKGVSFATGSATLKASASDMLRSVASAMKADDDLEVEIGGHTDSVGLAARNQSLSERRAQAVKDFLVKDGVAASRLTVVGYGSSKAVDSNDTPTGRANNRRVEFKLTAN